MEPDHNFHVFQYKLKFFPFKVFFLLIFLFFFIGFILGNFWGEFHALCQLKSIVHG